MAYDDHTAYLEIKNIVAPDGRPEFFNWPDATLFKWGTLDHSDDLGVNEAQVRDAYDNRKVNVKTD